MSLAMAYLLLTVITLLSHLFGAAQPGRSAALLDPARAVVELLCAGIEYAILSRISTAMSAGALWSGEAVDGARLEEGWTGGAPKSHVIVSGSLLVVPKGLLYYSLTHVRLVPGGGLLAALAS